jgi:hypothetical protein
MECDPITELQRCFALVRPVGMTDSAARDWLAVAVAEVRNIPPATLQRACAEVRQTATHHGQIIPALVKAAQEVSKPDPFAWALACHRPEQTVVALTDDRQGQPKRLGTLIKQIKTDD